MVHATCPPMACVARVLYADALLVVSPVTRVPGYVLVVHTLSYPTRPADDVVRGDVRPWVVEPAYGARVGALRYVDNYVVYLCGTSIALGVIAAVGRSPDRSAVVSPPL
jgi:hypothetical protein